MSTVVLMYHRVDEPRHDPWGLCVSPSHFAEQLDVIRRNAQPLALRHCATDPADASARVAVTFDDGYLDNLVNAVPALEAAGVPATVFIVSDAVGAREEFWWDQLEQCFRGPWAAPRQIDVEAGDVRAAGELGSDEESLRAVHSFLLRLAPAEIAPALAEIRHQLGVSDPTLERRAVDDEELAQLASSPMIEIGAHTRRHANLLALPAHTRLEEIEGSRIELRTRLERPVDAFSYPFGAADQATVACARRAGFLQACTVTPGRVSADTDPLAIPRHTVEDWDGDEFERRLRSWLAGG